MKYLDIIAFIYFALSLLVCAFSIWAVVKFNNLTNENKTEIPGLLDSSDLSESDMGIQYSEQPFIECY